MKALIELWILFGIFAILFLYLETYRFAVRKINSRITPLEHAIILVKEVGWGGIPLACACMLLGPIALIVMVVAIRSASKEMIKKYNLDDEED